MRTIPVLLLLLLLAALPSAEVVKNGVKSDFEVVPLKVLEKIVITQDGYTYTGFAVNYKGHRIVVSSIIGGVTAKVGDEISVMVSRIELDDPAGNGKLRTMQFMAMQNPPVPAPQPAKADPRPAAQ